MTAQTVSLRILKGAPLSVLFALCMGTFNSLSDLTTITGYTKKTVESALAVLEKFGLAVQVEQSWIGTPRAVVVRENLVLLGGAGLAKLDQPVDNSPLAEKNFSPLINVVDDHIDSEEICQQQYFNSPAPKKKVPPVDKHRLEAILLAAGVYPAIAKMYARHVVEGKKVNLDLRLALGWLAFAVKNGGSLGGVIVKKIKEGEVPPDEFLPPTHYDFEQALAWAKGDLRTEPDSTIASSDKPNPINDNSIMRRNLIRALRSVEISLSECNLFADEILGGNAQGEMDKRTDLLAFTSLDVLALIAYGKAKRNIGNLAGFVITEIRKGNYPLDRYRAPTADLQRAIQWTFASPYERDTLVQQWETDWQWFCCDCEKVMSGPEALYPDQQSCNSCGGRLMREDWKEIANV